MDLIDIEEFGLLSERTVFGTYLNRPSAGHFCVNHGRRTVDGRRLSWLWIFPGGAARSSNNAMPSPPPLVWTRQEILAAYAAAQDNMLPMFTRHVEKYAELAITFCLEFPRR